MSQNLMKYYTRACLAQNKITKNTMEIFYQSAKGVSFLAVIYVTLKDK